MTFPDPRGLTILGPIMLVVAFALALAANGLAAIHAQETLTVRGIVENGTSGAAVSAEISVLLLVSGPEEGLVSTGQASTDQSGRFQFEQVPKSDGGTYSLSADYAGVFYGASFTLRDLSSEVTLAVYEPTRDVSVVKVTTQVLVISDIDRKNRQISATEFVRISNESDRTLLPDLANPQQMSFLRFSLPPLAEELDVGTDLPGGDVVSVGTGFALTSPVMPGEHTLRFTFRFPYRSDSVSYRQNLPQGAEVYQVMVPERLADVGVSPLESIPAVNVEGTTYRAWEGRSFEPGQGLVLEFGNLPQPNLGQRLQKSITGGTLWKVAIPGAFGVVLASLLLIGALKAPRRVASPQAASAGDGEEDLAEREGLVREIASLDEGFQLGEVAEADYHQQRESLVTRILETGAPSGSGAEESRENLTQVNG